MIHKPVDLSNDTLMNQRIRLEVNWNRSNSFWGHVSIETTERYLGCKQRFQNAVNDGIGLEPGGS